MEQNTYKEYKDWLNENKEFIEALEKKAPELSQEFELEFYILDVLSELAENDEKLDEDHDDVFYLGFDYISYVYQLLRLFAEQLYDNDLELMDKQIDNILAYIYMDILILNVEMELDLLDVDYNEITAKLNDKLEEAEHLIVDKKDITLDIVEQLEDEVAKISQEYDFDIYLDDILLFEYAEEHNIVELEEEN